MGFVEDAWKAVSGQTARENRERFEQAQRIIETAKEKYEQYQKKLDMSRTHTEKKLGEFGQYRVNCISSDISAYVDVFSSFGNLEYNDNLPALAGFNLPMENRQMLQDLRLTTNNTLDIIKTNTLAAGASALAVIGTYGAGMLIGTTQAGVALSSLAGLTKAKAFIGWLGHGSMLAGGLTFLGLTIIPFNVVSGLINQSKSKEALAEAQKKEAEVNLEIGKMKTAIALCREITNVADDYESFMADFRKLFQPLIQKMNEIRERESRNPLTQEKGYVDFQTLPDNEKKAIHLSWIMVQIYNKLLKTPLMSENDTVSPEATKMLASAREQQLSLLPGLVDLSNDGCVEIPEIREQPIWLWLKRKLTASNWIIAFALIAICALSAFWDAFDKWIPNRNVIGFAIGLGLSGALICPALTQRREKQSIFGKNKERRKRSLLLLLQLVIAAAEIAGTYLFFGRG